jgi:hypothetical protein
MKKIDFSGLKENDHKPREYLLFILFCEGSKEGDVW